MAKKPLICLLSLGLCAALLITPALADSESNTAVPVKETSAAVPISESPLPADELILKDSLFYVTDHSVYFADVTEKYAWAINEIDYLANTKTISGTGNCLFSPDATIRRGDFLLMLYRAYDMSMYVNGENFTDVPADAYYADALSACRALGIATADAEGKFYPTRALTRQDAMVFLYRTLERTGLLLPSGDLSAFTDASRISDYAIDAVSALVHAGVISGAGGELSPTGEVSRASMAVMLYRALMISVEDGETGYVPRDDVMNICIGSSIYPNVTVRNLPDGGIDSGLYELVGLWKTGSGYEIEMGAAASFSDQIGFRDGKLTVNNTVAETADHYEAIAVDVYGHLDGLYATGSSEYTGAAVVMENGVLRTIYYKK